MVAWHFLVYITEKHMVAARHFSAYIAEKPLVAV
jgi:hypothetical protein